MWTPRDGATITASRQHWAGYVRTLEGVGLHGDAHYIANQVGCWGGDDYPSVPVDAAGLALYEALTLPPACEACDGWGVEDPTGNPCPHCDGSGHQAPAAKAERTTAETIAWLKAEEAASRLVVARLRAAEFPNLGNSARGVDPREVA